MVSDSTAISDDRSLTPDERALIHWLLEHGTTRASGFIEQLSAARVVSRCGCGCASLNFAISDRLPSSGSLEVLADYQYHSAEGDLFGVFVFERSNLLAGVEVWSIDGKSTPTMLPSISQLRPIDAVTFLS